MSKEIKVAIDQIEDALKAGITQKSSVASVVDKVHKAKPIVETDFGFDSPPALLLKDAEMCARRAHSELESATRKMARAIACIDENADHMRETQTDAFDQNSESDDDTAGDQDVQGTPRLLGDGDRPEIELERTESGGDAFESFSLHLIQGADGETPVLRTPFEYDGRRYVAVAMSPGYWIEACGILSPAEAEETEFAAGADLAGQRAIVLEQVNEETGVEHPVVLGNRVRFVVDRSDEDEVELDPDLTDEISGDGVAAADVEHPGTDEEVDGDDEDAELATADVGSGPSHPWDGDEADDGARIFD